MARPEKEGRRQPLAPWRGRDHAVDGGAQISIRGEFQQLADIDDESALARRRLDPGAVFGLNFEAADAVLQNEERKPLSLCGPTPCPLAATPVASSRPG